MRAFRVLAFDIGATKTTAALFTGQKDDPFNLEPPSISQLYRNSDFAEPEALIAAGLDAARTDVDVAVLAVAGPVIQDNAQLTNRPWSINRAGLKKRFSLPSLCIINDLQAFAYGIPYLKPNEVYVLNRQPPIEHATIAVIAPGTGLGESFMTWSNGRYFAHASEGGHTDFAPVDPTQIELLTFLMQAHDHVSCERLCSGRGLQNIYRFLKDHRGMNEPAWLSAKFANEKHPSNTIVDAANDTVRPSEICRQTVSLFVSILGSTAGNLALRTMPRGGVYIGGGILPHIDPRFISGCIMAAFSSKGRMKPILETIPVNIILNPRIQLHGAAYHGLQSSN